MAGSAGNSGFPGLPTGFPGLLALNGCVCYRVLARGGARAQVLLRACGSASCTNRVEILFSGAGGVWVEA